MATTLKAKIRAADELVTIWAKAQVSSPEWFQVMDMCMGQRLQERRDKLEARVKKPKRKTRR